MSDNIYTNLTMKALILIKRLCLRHILIRLPSLLSTPPPHTQLQAAVIQSPVATNLLYPPLWGERPRVIMPLPRPASRGIGSVELGVIPHRNGPGTSAREMLGDRDPRKTLLLLQLADLRVVHWHVSRPA